VNFFFCLKFFNIKKNSKDNLELNIDINQKFIDYNNNNKRKINFKDNLKSNIDKNKNVIDDNPQLNIEKDKKNLINIS